VNHDNKRIIGNVEWAEYEDGRLEGVFQTKNKIYAERLRKHDPSIHGLSVQASYLYNKCVKCGEQFYSEKGFRQHMDSAHGIIEGITEPHGIIFDALALVEGPEVPGVPTTEMDLWETKGGFLRLAETLIEDRGYSKEQAQLASEQPPAHPVEQGHPECGPNAHWDEEKRECVADNIEERLQKLEKRFIAIKKYGEMLEDLESRYDAFVQESGGIPAKESKEGREIGLSERLSGIQNQLDLLTETYTIHDKLLRGIWDHVQEQPQLRESENTSKRLQALEIKYDNLEAKVKGQFKGHQKEREKTPEHIDDPKRRGKKG